MKERLLIRGQARSGTSILTNILHHEPEICTGYELLLYDYIYNNPERTTKDAVGRLIMALNASHRSATKHANTTQMEVVKKRLITEIDNNMSSGDFILKAEEILFPEMQVAGDKVPELLSEASADGMLNDGLNFKMIFIYRDGRDVAASKIRHLSLSDGRTEVPHWASADVEKTSKIWTDAMNTWRQFKRKYESKVSIMELKFEDFLDNRDWVIAKLARFTEIDEKIIAANTNKLFKEGKHHRGYYKEWIPDWQSKFSDEAKRTLSTMGYK